MEPQSKPSGDPSPTGDCLKGTGVVPGVAYAPVVWLRPRAAPPLAGAPVPEDARQQEFEHFLAAAEVVAGRLRARADAAGSDAAGSDAADILRAVATMAGDKAWRREVRTQIASGHRAEYAVVLATERFTGMFAKVGGRTAERIVDLRDIRDRVIAEIRGEPEPGLPVLDQPAVLLAEDIAPADTATLDTSQVAALVTCKGGPTSHTAILARQLDLPCIVALGAGARELPAGSWVLVDGTAGTLRTEVPAGKAHRAVAEARERAREIEKWRGPAKTRDGQRISLLASVADVAAARRATRTQAEGIGLFRTEMNFLRAEQEPGVEVQAEVYAEVLAMFPDQKVVLRTFDAGSDKPLAFADPGEEENPALGVRGIRVAAEYPDLLTHQLDAMSLAAERTDRSGATAPRVMAPMLSTVGEAEWFARQCRERGLIPGAMIEVPAAALMADLILPHLDFVSIGTNDLTQYIMAADRLSPQLAGFTDPWQPAVLRLIRFVGQQGRLTATSVGVCGESAADPLLACVLVGLGVQSLSPAATAISAVGVRLAAVDLTTCQQAAEAALQSPGATAARAAAGQILAG